mmetsp:Transcript_23262/g.65370  ORF Transcript_23262/g.65370 Transcript_23262/m.65370 type:complete len:220 (-) Transcript_23262:222-881(-)
MLPMYQAELVPTDFALRMRTPFTACLLNLVVLVVAKFAIRDWWGAVSLIFVILMGMFVLIGAYRVNASSALFFCVMATISGIFDVISCVLYFQHSKYKLFDPKASSLALLAQVVFLTSPIALFMAAIVSYAIFTDCRDHNMELRPFFGSPGFDYGLGGFEGLAQQPIYSQPTPARQQAVPVPFSGQGLRLDGTVIPPASGNTAAQPVTATGGGGGAAAC